MKRLTSGALLLAAVLVAASCNNVTGDLAQGATRVTVDPNPIAFTRGKTGTVLVQNFDDQGSALLSAATVSGAVTGPVTVEMDTNFQHGGTHYATQFIITSTGAGVGMAFVRFSDAGLTTAEDTVIIVPNDTNPVGTLSATNPATGDTVTFTVADPYRIDAAFVTDTTKIGATVDSTKLRVVDVSADSLSMRFIAPAGVPTHDGPVEVSNVHARIGPHLVGTFKVQSTANLVVP